MSGKKKIIIMSHAMELGGAERSLIGLLEAFDTEKYEVDLFLLRQEGELLDAIPEKINMLPEIPAYTVLARPMKDTLKEGHLCLTFARLIGKIAAQGYNRFHHYTDSGVELEYSHKYTAALLPKINPSKEYDVAISFLTPHYFTIQKIRAKKKIAWIHTDYSKIQINIDSERKMWGAYDHIVSISDSVTKTFLSVFPELESKIVLIENILPKKLIEEQRQAFSVKEEMAGNEIKILSIGRYCRAKNFDNIPEICSKLIAKKQNVYWYIIGYGSDENLIREQITKFQMQDRVILLGKKENPYPYIDACDLYIQPSRYEGKSVTVREAQMLGKPVVITAYATAQSQLIDGYDGIIVPMDNEGCAEGIEKLLKCSEIKNTLIENCEKKDYSNSREIIKLYKMIDQ